MIPHCRVGSARIGWLVILAAAEVLGVTPSPVSAQADDHPAGKPIQVGTDFGIAPFVVRSPSGPEGFSVDMVKEVARRIKRPGVELADMNMSGLISAAKQGEIPRDATVVFVHTGGAPALFAERYATAFGPPIGA